MRENEEIMDEEQWIVQSRSLYLSPFKTNFLRALPFFLPSFNVELMALTPFAAECETHRRRRRVIATAAIPMQRGVTRRRQEARAVIAARPASIRVRLASSA